ncbi:DDE superfamily endonuclease [Ceratobasidium sp. AG-Ba]|nr:DDE superfamily endonuclease [Ceratobasidium sp. AG-Ba]
MTRRKRSSANQRPLSVAPARPTVTVKIQHLTNFDKLQVIDIYHSLPAGTSLARAIPVLRQRGYTTVSTSTLSRYLHAEWDIREYVAVDSRRLYEKHTPKLRLPQVDAATAQWVIQTLHSPRARITGEMICEKAREFCRLMGIPDDALAFSNGWLHRFKIRMGLAHYLFYGEAASAPIERLQDERYCLLSMIIWYMPFNVYNCDETALLWSLIPAAGLAFHSMPGLKLDKNDSRTCIAPIWMAWMVHSIWKIFLSELNEDMRRQNRYILLLCDNAPSHKHDNNDYSNIHIKPMMPNVTAWLQPMDGGIIASWKAQYRRRFIRYALDRNSRGATAEDMYKISQLDAMRMAHAAWEAVTPQTIHNCWRHVGLVPSTGAYYGPPVPAHFEPAQYPWDNNTELGLSMEDAAALAQVDDQFETEGLWSDEEIARMYM